MRCAPGQIVAHTSGAHGLAVLAPVTTVGARPLALHPAMTFTGTAVDLRRLAEGVSFGVTAPDELRDLAASLVADLGGRSSGSPRSAVRCTTRPWRTAPTTSPRWSTRPSTGSATPASGTREQVLAPLLGAALDNTLRLGDAAITGPVSRGDAGTVAKHLQALESVAPESVPPYLALARRTADRVIAAGRLRPMDAEPLLDVLSTVSSLAPPLAPGRQAP